MNKYNYILLAGFVIWFIGTWHGGFQMEAQSNFERFTDSIFPICIVWGILGDILQGLHVTKNTNITADVVNCTNHVEKTCPVTHKKS